MGAERGWVTSRVANMSSQQHGAIRVSYVICSPSAKGKQGTPGSKSLRMSRQQQQSSTPNTGPLKHRALELHRLHPHKVLATEMVPKSWGWGVGMSSQKSTRCWEVGGRNPAVDLECKCDSWESSRGLRAGISCTSPGGSAKQVRFPRNTRVRVLQRQNQQGIQTLKELAHTMVGLAGWKLRQELMPLSGGRIPSSQETCFCS